MVVGAAVAEPEFQNHTVDVGDEFGGAVKAGALRLEPADETVEPAHAPIF